MFGINKEQFLSFFRHLVTFIGGALVAKGKLDPGSLETITGILVSLAGIVWGFLAPEKTMTAETVIAKLEPEKVDAINKVIAAPSPPKPKATVTVNETGVEIKPAQFPPVQGA